jgi:hypothetical protein
MATFTWSIPGVRSPHSKSAVSPGNRLKATPTWRPVSDIHFPAGQGDLSAVLFGLPAFGAGSAAVVVPQIGRRAAAIWLGTPTLKRQDKSSSAENHNDKLAVVLVCLADATQPDFIKTTAAAAWFSVCYWPGWVNSPNGLAFSGECFAVDGSSAASGLPCGIRFADVVRFAYRPARVGGNDPVAAASV